MATTPKVDSFIDSLRSRILAGEFGDGKLPPFRELVSEYKTSQETMNKAIQALQAEGAVVSRGVKGVFVNTGHIRMPGIVGDFPNYLKSQGLTPKSEFIKKPEIIKPSPEVKDAMKLGEDDLVLCRQRKQGTDTSLFRVTTEYYNMKFINERMLEEIYKDPQFNIVLAIKEDFGKVIQFAEEEVVAHLANKFEQEHLQLVRNNPVIESKSINYTENKKEVILYFHKMLNANHFILTYNHKFDSWE